MSKSQNKSAKPNTAVLCLDADLSAAVDAILPRLKGRTPSKAELLNVLSATLCGDKHDWGFIKKSDKPVVSKRAKGHLTAILNCFDPVEKAASVDEFTQHCIDVAYSAYIHVAETDGDIGDAEDDNLFSRNEINAACLKASKELIFEKFGNPVQPSLRGMIQGFGDHHTITDLVIDHEWVRLLNILDIEGRRAVSDEEEYALSREEQEREEQDQNELDQEIAQMRESVEPSSPGTLGEYGRNPGAFMAPKTKVIGYQVFSASRKNYFGGRSPYEVLSAAVAERDMAVAKDINLGEAYAILRVLEGDIKSPIFVDE
tara:strand:+ start:242 stop:1186 length:945 start_codon:yes stop_codon:yes gene_type:complete